MNIALVGYGKMGKSIEKIARERGHTISLVVNSKHPIEQADFSQVDVAIEFSTPSLALHHIHFFLDHNIPCVVGTTGWHEHLEEIREKALMRNAALLHASNFSIGVNLFFKINEEMAKLMGTQSDYKVTMEEIHHTQKLDAPSGTAISLAQGIIDHHEHYTNWNCLQNLENKQPATDKTISIDAVRLPDVPGTHKIEYTSPIDTITIAHQAHNRLGFAKGAVIGAEWLLYKHGVFTMRDVLTIK